MTFILCLFFLALGLALGWAIFYPMGRKDVLMHGPTGDEFNRYLSGLDEVTKPRL